MKIVGKKTFFLYLNACNKVCKVLLEDATFMVCGDLGEPVERAEQTLTGSHCHVVRNRLMFNKVCASKAVR